MDMRYKKLHSELAHMRAESAHLLSDAFYRKKNMTNRDLAAYTGLSEVSVAKASDILFDSGMISEDKYTNPDTGRECSRMSLYKNNSFILCDLSLKSCAMLCLDGSFNVIAHYHEKRALDATYDDIERFIIRAEGELSRHITSYSGICVILPKDTSSKEDAARAFENIFGHIPEVFLTRRECIVSLCGTHLGLDSPPESLFYINIGEDLEGYYTSNGLTCTCDLDRFIFKDVEDAYTGVGELFSSQELLGILYEILNSARALLSPTVCIIESERFILGSQSAVNLSQKLKMSLSEKKKLHISDRRPYYYQVGAMVHLTQVLMESILKK